jgi:ankyrin repeat protein
MVEMLLERAGADPNAQTAKDRTPLHYAASKAEDGDEERREVLRVLRDWGADPGVEDRDGETARDVAQTRGHWDAAATLRRAEKRWEEEHRQGWLQRHGFMK